MWVLLLALDLVGLMAVPHVLLSGKRPLSMLIWTGALLLFPGVGLLAYLLVGNDRVRRRRFKRHRRRFDEWGERHRSRQSFNGLDDADRQLLAAVSRISRHPVTSIQEIDAYYSGGDYYPELISAIDAAGEFIHAEMYMWRDDDTGRRILDALVKAAGRGLEVRLMVDEIGSVEVRERFFRPLVDAGGRFSWFYTVHPRRNRYFFNLRNHRKLMIIDGLRAFVGGINIGAEYEGRDPAIGDWKDLQIRVQGEVVNHLHEVFRHDWYFSTEENLEMSRYVRSFEKNPDCPAVVVESGPATQKGIALNILVAVIGRATDRLDLFTPYFVPEEALVSAIQVAAARGVKVRLMVSKKSDYQVSVDIGRSFYDELLDSGIDIYEYDRAMNHAKLAVVDRQWVLVGSANLDARSMYLNFEVGVLFKSTDLYRRMESYLEGLFEDAARIDQDRFSRRSTWQRLKQGAFRLLAPIL
ncbi:MAG: cardiolipin synthase [Desulfobacterales bacterium]